MKAYYNEFDPYCAEWLRELIFAELIPDGDVDERSIEDVKPHELDGYTQCHFFAGIGGWPLALRLAGWPEDRQVWTGSCPCQPFSAAGKRKGVADERHLWPAFYWLIRQCRPGTVFGEQVASKDGRTWLAGVQADLEALGYSAAGTDLCAAGVGAPHIRQRLWWVADAAQPGDSGRGVRGHAQGSGAVHGQETEQRSERGRTPDADAERSGGLADAGCDVREPDARPSELPGAEGQAENEARERQRGGACDSAGCAPGGGLGDPYHQGSQGRGRSGQVADSQRRAAEERHATAHGLGSARDGGLPDAESQRRQRGADAEGSHGESATERGESSPDVKRDRYNPWSDCLWLPCADGKARRIEPGIEPLAHGVPARVGKLRAYGNAIVPQVAAEVIGSYLDSEWLL